MSCRIGEGDGWRGAGRQGGYDFTTVAGGRGHGSEWLLQDRVMGRDRDNSL